MDLRSFRTYYRPGLAFGFVITALVRQASAQAVPQHSDVGVLGSETTQKALYGQDDRREVYETSPELQQVLRESLVALIPSGTLIAARTGTYRVQGPLLSDEGWCPEERFSNQPAAASCSGVLVDDDLVLTAAHCLADGRPPGEVTIADANCHDFAYVLNYMHSSADANPSAVRLLEAHECRRIALFSYTADSKEGLGTDFALVRLKEPVSAGHKPVSFSTRKIRSDDRLTLAGFPLGLPAKVHEGVHVVRESTKYEDYWYTLADSYHGNSGSPLFDSELRLAGLLIQGQSDYDPKSEQTTNSCITSKVYPDDPEQLVGAEIVAGLDALRYLLCATALAVETKLCEQMPEPDEDEPEEPKAPADEASNMQAAPETLHGSSCQVALGSRLPTSGLFGLLFVMSRLVRRRRTTLRRGPYGTVPLR